MAVFIKAKEALVKKLTFLKPLPNLIKLLVTFNKSFYIKITEEIVAQTLMTLATTKVFGTDKINFPILCIT